MVNAYVGEIRMVCLKYAPNGWLFCDGQILSIDDYEALFSVISNRYGGDGINTFALPDMRGRTPIHVGNGYTMAQSGGDERIVLGINQIPTHSHLFIAADNVANSPNPENNFLGKSSQIQAFYHSTTDWNMTSDAIGTTGGGQSHENMMPFLCLNFIISAFGIFPSPT